MDFIWYIIAASSTPRKEHPMETITETGYLKDDGHVEIGTSAIFTRLIQEAGRWCESYASDLLVDIESIKSVLGHPPTEWKTIRPNATESDDGTIAVEFRLGFRQNGVDHAEWIDTNLKDDCRKYHYYRSIWKIEIAANKTNRVTMTLSRLQ